MRAALRRVPWKRVLLGLALGLLLVVAIPPLRDAAVAGTGRVVLWLASPFAPDIDEFEALPTTSRVIAADGTLIAELDGGEKRQLVRLRDLPDHVVKAVLAAEDARFYDHGGVDPSAVFRAVLRTSQGDLQGGSTITQQLAKINYTEGERTLFRKGRELLYATRLEREYSKDALLERYLNQVYFGDGAYGIASAANRFFGVQAPQLDAAQAALLAGKIRSPEGLDPRKRPERATARRNQVIANMQARGWLPAKAAADARRAPLALAPPPPPTRSSAPHFVEFVKREVANLPVLGGSADARPSRLFNGGYVVETTLDRRTMAAAAEAVAERLGGERGPDDPSASVVSVVPGDGAIRALYDGPDVERSFDVASLGARQPGSAFKPFVYLAMLRAGIDPRSTFDARSPMELSHPAVGPFTVENYEGRSSGPIDVDKALVDSVNTVFSQLALEVTPEAVAEAARDAGITAELKPFPAIALGGLTKGVSPLEMAAAYATFAGNGVYAEPYSVRRIRDRSGKVVYEREPERREAFLEAEVGVLNRPLQEVVRSGTGRGAAIGRPVAGKTGTTQNYGDAWFAGYTPQLATAVWVGHPEKLVSMTGVRGVNVTGGSFPASIFATVMRAALEGQPPLPIPESSGGSLGLSLLRPAPPPSTTSSSTSSTSSTTSTSVVGGPVVIQTTSTTQRPVQTTSTTRPRQTTTSSTSSTSTTTTTTQPRRKATGDASAPTSTSTTTTTPR